MFRFGFYPANIGYAVVRRYRYIFGGAALAVVLVLGSAAPHFIAHRVVRADARPQNLPAHRHATFARALIDAYQTFVRTDRQKYGTEFDTGRFEAKIAAIRAGQLPKPTAPGDYDLENAGAVALMAARTRLMRALGGTARDAAPLFAAKAQVAFDCWAARAGARLPDTDIAACRDRFSRSLDTLENAVLPVRTTSVFNRTLAREYLAYAAFKAKVRRDFIDASHFAHKGLVAARSNDPDAVQPEVLARWNLDSRMVVPRFLRWRQRLVDALAHHRTGPLAAIAAKAQARFDCWVENAAEGSPARYVRRCETDFVRYLQRLKSAPPPRRSLSLVVLFQKNRARIPPRQYAAIKRAAALAKRTGAQAISVIARTPRPGTNGYDVRLAKRRAAAVARALQMQGIRRDRIRTLYLSEAPPAKGDRRTAGRLLGQRAEIVIH